MLNAEKRREILKQAEDIIEEIKCEEVESSRLFSTLLFTKV